MTSASTIGARRYDNFKDDLRAGLAATTALPGAGRLVPTGGSVGQFLRRTATGSEWAAAPAGSQRTREATIDLLTGDTGGDVDFTRDGSGNSSDLRGTLRDDTVGADELDTTGTPSATTFLRGDMAWAAPTAARQVRWLNPPTNQRYSRDGTTYNWIFDSSSNLAAAVGAATGADGDQILAGVGSGASVQVIRYVRAGAAWNEYGYAASVGLTPDSGARRGEGPLPGGDAVAPEWAAENSYPRGSLVTRQSALWRAINAIVGNPANLAPDNDAANWYRVGPQITLRTQADPDGQVLRSIWLTSESGVTTEWALPGAAGALPTMTGATRGRLLRQSPVREEPEWTLPLAPAVDAPLAADRHVRGAFPSMGKYSRGTLNPTSATTLAAYRGQCTDGPGGNADSTFRPPARITSDIDAPDADNYILRQRWLVQVPAATWDQFQISVDSGLDDKVSVHLLLSDKFGRLDGAELAHVFLDYQPPGTAASAVQTIALSAWGDPDDDGARWAVIEAYAIEHTGAENFDWKVSTRTRGANLPRGPFTVNGTDGGFPVVTAALEEDTLSLDIDATLRVNDDDELGVAPLARGAWAAGTYERNSLVEYTDTGVTYLLLSRVSTAVRPVIADIVSGTQTAWLILGTKQLVERYALVGNPATIPLAKLPPVIPDERLPGSILRDNEVEDFALTTSTTAVPLRKIAQTIARVTNILPWARSGNNDPIPADKLTNAPSGKVPAWWRGRWATGQSYAAGDAVERRGCWYYATSAHTSASTNTPETSGAPWHSAGHLATDHRTADVTGWCLHRGDWLSNQNYEVNNVVRRSGTTYVCTQRNGATLQVAGTTVGAKDPAVAANSAYWTAW